MSKQEHKEQARNLYVIHQLSLADIADRLGLSTRTLQNWKKDGDWEKERSMACGTEGAFHAELFAMGEVLARQIRLDMEAGRNVAPERFAALDRIVATAERSRKYEKETPKQAKDDRTPEQKRLDVLLKIKDTLGVK